ncbi:MAG: tetratricopeptide repeat protein [Planctomycetota bacterium]
MAAIGLGLSLTIVGCGGSTPRATGSLASVERAIQFGDLEQASYRLSAVEGEPKLSESERDRAALLRAELAIATGKAEDALAAVAPVIEDETLGAAALELRGKALVRLGDFREAGYAFEAAEASYRERVDRSRAADLRLLASGLDAYAGGDFVLARRYWADIQSQRLRDSVTRLSGGGTISQASYTSNAMEGARR